MFPRTLLYPYAFSHIHFIMSWIQKIFLFKRPFECKAAFSLIDVLCQKIKNQKGDPKGIQRKGHTWLANMHGKLA